MGVDSVVWTREGLRSAGFRGFVPLASVERRVMPHSAGVYVVLRHAGPRPELLPASRAGWRVGRKNPLIDVTTLRDTWIDAATVIYIGKASTRKRGGGLDARISEFRAQGRGGTGHSGGQRIWQLVDADELEIAWLETPTAAPRDVEKALIRSFVEEYGKRPFANLND